MEEEGEVDMSKITLSIKWDPNWQQFSVPYYEDGIYQEGPTYYASDLLEAQETLAAEVKELEEAGHKVHVRENRYTRGWRISPPTFKALDEEAMDEAVFDYLPQVRSGETLEKVLSELYSQTKFRRESRGK